MDKLHKVKLFENYEHRDGEHFFKTNRCDRCSNSLINKGRILSWFTEDTICMICKEEEDNIKKSLPTNGKEYEGCGYIPNRNNRNESK